MKKKILKAILIFVIAVFLLVVTVFSAFSIGEKIMFADFYSNAEIHGKIPGLWSGYVPQGYCCVKGEDVRLSCGYMNDGKASRIYIIPNDGGRAESIELSKADGSLYDGHTGGIAVYGDNVFVTGATGLDIFSYADVTDGDGKATQKDVFNTPLDPAYCFINEGNLYVGSFYRAGNYETPAEQRMTTPAGDGNTAVMAVYTIDVETCLPSSNGPSLVYSTTGLVQGATLTEDGKMILSTSYGLAKSHLYIYDLSKATEKTEMYTFGEHSVPLKYLDSASLIETVEAPPMSEEIIYKDGIIYIMTESASVKYLFGKLTTGSYVYGYKYQ
ncbi:MAG: hypothetical protein E7577_05515 [Ruminococcaceae bacterium]|nr:hypothetical protein [Oscillospiraceae bacterium]